MSFGIFANSMLYKSQKFSDLKVAVLAGGIGQERSVSLQSGECVTEALKQAGFEVVLADIIPENMEILDDESIDVFFIALHGQFGEDGQLQQILEDKSLIYTGSGPQASKLAFDKAESKRIFHKRTILTPKMLEIKKADVLIATTNDDATN